MTMTLFEQIQQQLHDAYAPLSHKFSTRLFEQLLEPQHIHETTITLTKDDGTEATYKWRRAQHNNAKWPYKWWIRFHSDVSLDEVKSLSAWMSLKTALVDLPLWWWKWWVIVDPKKHSHNELEALARWYIKKLHMHLWSEKDIPAPDVNTNSTIMWWMVDEYAKQTWTRKPWMITGKPIAIWWSLWRNIATAHWWLMVLQRYLEHKQDTLHNKKIIIQWAWNAWLTFAQLAVKQWAVIVWISDSQWWIYNEAWLDIDTITTIKAQKASITQYQWVTVCWSRDILTMSCDILVPAALENQITEDNAHQLDCSVILELANWPTTAWADLLINEKNITLIPDILANAWWVTVSYFEQVQNNTMLYRDEDTITEQLKDIMHKATDAVVDASKQYKKSLRWSAYIVAVERILQAMYDRGR